MRISDWSSDVCSSDLAPGFEEGGHAANPSTVIPWKARPLQKRSRRSPFSVMPDLFRHPTLFKSNRLCRAAPRWTPEQVRGDGGVCKGIDFAEGRKIGKHTSELQSLLRSSYAVSCLKKHTNMRIA